MKMLSSIQVETTVCLWIKIIVLNLNNEDLYIESIKLS